MNRRTLVYKIAVVCLALTTVTLATDWTRFRGPNGSGISTKDRPAPTRWSPTQNISWKTQLPGPGTSSPIIVGDRIYLTCYSGYGVDRDNPGEQENLKRHLVCLDRKSGSLLWNSTVDAVLPEDPYSGIGVPEHGYASSTPVSDGQDIYVFFGKTGALSFDRDGKKRWQTAVGSESDPRLWGSAASPILHRNLLIVPAMAESEAIVALDTKTGQEVWRQEAVGLSMSWCTPLLVPVDDKRTDLVIGVAGEIWGLNPQTGKLRWYAQGVKGDSFYSSIVSDGKIVYAVEGRGGGSIAVRVGGEGNVTESHVLWTGSTSNRIATPIVYEGRLYALSNNVVTAIDTETGKRVANRRLRSGGGRSRGGRGGDYGSPVIADGKFYFVKRSGDMHVLDLRDKLKPVSVNRVTNDSEDFSATPAISDGELYIRSNRHLYCVAPLGQAATGVALAHEKDAKPDAKDEEENVGSRRGRRGGRPGGNFDPAAVFKQRDTNGDGKLTGDELSERMRSNIKQLDPNSDGAVTLEEFQKGIGQMFGGRSRGGRGQGGRGDRDRNPREGKPDRPQRPDMEK